MCSIRKFWVRRSILPRPDELARANSSSTRIPDEVKDTNTVFVRDPLLE
jgi:hypothetical protein